MSNLAEQYPRLRISDVQAAPPARNGWSVARTALRWAATATLLGWLAFHTNWHDVGLAFASASIPWLLTAAGLVLASQLASVARWELIVRASGLTHPRRLLLTAYLEGMFVNVCLPTTVGGDVLKVMRVGGAQHKRIVTGTVIADRASGLATLFVLLAIGLLMKFDDSRGTYTAPFAAVAVLVVLLIAGRLSSPIRTAISTARSRPGAVLRKWLLRLQPLVPSAIQQLVMRTPWNRVFLWALVVQSLNVAAVAAAARAIGLTIPVAGILVATTTVSLVAALPISIAGIGVREASLPLLLAADGVPRGMAIALGLLLSGTILAVGLLGGPVHFFEQRRARSAPKGAVPADTNVARRAA